MHLRSFPFILQENLWPNETFMQKIISIQSHVAEGYAGNKAAVFPLQRLGIDVTVMNTVQFSNHTGHAHYLGQTFAAKHIDDLFEGLALNNKLNSHQALITGYLGQLEIGQCIIKQLINIRQTHPDFIYCCDTVFGDYATGTYASKEMPAFFRNEILPYADIITPNQYELEILTDQKITDIKSALKACQHAREMGPKIVLLTSFSEPNSSKIGMFLSTKKESWLIESPKHKLRPTVGGTGDISSAIFLAHYLNQMPLFQVLTQTFNSLYGLIKKTADLNKEELALIEAQEEIVFPTSNFKAIRIK